MRALPSVSVLLPVRDAAGTLAACLDSLIGQTFAGFEVVAVDDGSADGSADLLAAAARRDPRVRLLRQPSAGLVAALRRAVAESRAPILARMDADDLCHPDRLALQAAALGGDPALDVVACRVAYRGDRGRHAGYARHVDWTNTLLDHEEISLNRFVESPLAHPSAMFRRTAWDRLGGYREGDFPEDYELWLRWLEGGARFRKLSETLLEWSDPPGRLSRRDPRYAPEAFYRIKAPYLARWLAGVNPHHPHVTVRGAGVESRRRAEELTRHGVVIDGYIDISPGRIGQRIAGRPVIAPADLPPPGETYVIAYVGNRGARETIEAELAARGYRRGRDYVAAA